MATSILTVWIDRFSRHATVLTVWNYEPVPCLHVRQPTINPASIEAPAKAAITVDSKALLNKRALRANENDLESDESRILEYVREHGMINDGECRELLEIDRHRANYLLKKLNQ